MSPQKQSAARRRGSPDASHENRKRPKNSKPQGEPSQRQVKSGNARRREQIKRANQGNIDQQGNRANVRQTRRGKAIGDQLELP